MIGVLVGNLVVPEDPESLDILTPSGTWTLTRQIDKKAALVAIGRHECPETYILDHAASLSDGAAHCDQVFDELVPIFLASSYATGLAVTARRSSMGSEMQVLQATEHWPRARAIGEGTPVVHSAREFSTAVEAFVKSWQTVGRSEKVQLLIHHWLDALSSWSLEDLYLSATTLLQIIAATEERHSGQDLTFFEGVKRGFHRQGITIQDRKFVDMRNALIHEGALLAGNFSNKTREDAAAVAVDVLHMFDQYIHAIMGLGLVRKPRFDSRFMLQINAFSID